MDITLDDALDALERAEPARATDAADGLCDVWEEVSALASTPWRLAALIGQTAHESAGYSDRVEDLWYSAERIPKVWPSRFASAEAAAHLAGAPEALAEAVYGGRMGNDRPGDGWRYRGRGWLQLTGRNQYRWMAGLTGLPLEDRPEMAGRSDHAWRIAALYLAHSTMSGKTAFEWADAHDDRRVTLAVNRGVHGLSDRTRRTALALTALVPLGEMAARRSLVRRGSLILAMQVTLARDGHDPGPEDGLWGPRTARAAKAAMAA